MKTYHIRKYIVVFFTGLFVVIEIFLLELINIIFSVENRDLVYWVYLLFGVIIIFLIGYNEMTAKIKINENEIKKVTFISEKTMRVTEIVKTRHIRFLNLLIIFNKTSLPFVITGFYINFEDLLSNLIKWGYIRS